MDTERSSIKRKLLNKVIFRSDYRQLSDSEIEKIVEIIKNKEDIHFDYFSTELLSSFDLQTNDANIQDENSRILRLEDQVMYVFSKNSANDDKYSLKIGKTFLILEIYPSQEYKGTDIYYKLYSYILNIMFCELRYFNLSRIGVRKFNNLFLDASRLSDINKIFSKELIYIWELEGNKFKKKTMVDAYESGKYGFNIVRELDHGFLQFDEGDHKVDKEVYLIAFDYDKYSIDMEVLNLMRTQSLEILKTMNDDIFKIFKGSLNPEFLIFLKQQNPDLNQYLIYRSE